MNKEKNQIIIYAGSAGQPKIEVRIESETVWLSQAQMVELFQSSKSNVSEHIKNIFLEGELTPQSTVRNFRTVQIEGSRIQKISEWNTKWRRKRLSGKLEKDWEKGKKDKI